MPIPSINMNKSLFSFVAISISLIPLTICVINFDLNAQEQRPAHASVINIWPGTPPLHKSLKESESWNRWGLINVTVPTLTVYPANENKADGTAVLIMPGGGYNMVCINHEGHEAAQWFSERGVAAFVLKYRCKPFKHPVPLLDAQRAMRLIRHDAAKYNINPHRIGRDGILGRWPSGCHIEHHWADDFQPTH